MPFSPPLPLSPLALAPFRQIELKGREGSLLLILDVPPLSVWVSNISKKRSRHHLPRQQEHDISISIKKCRSHWCNLLELPPLQTFWGWLALETWGQNLFYNHSDIKETMSKHCWNQRQWFWIFKVLYCQNLELKTEIHCSAKLAVGVSEEG